MAHYTVNTEGNHSLSDLETKLADVNWDWDVLEHETQEHDEARAKYHDALGIYVNLRSKIIVESGDPKRPNKAKLEQLANLWDKYSSSKYKALRNW